MENEDIHKPTDFIHIIHNDSPNGADESNIIKLDIFRNERFICFALFRLWKQNMNMNKREAFMSIIAPIGIDMDEVIELLSEQSKQINYTPNVVKLTDFLRETGRVGNDYPNEVERYKAYIRAGDQLCSDAERGDILAMLGIARVVSADGDKRKVRSSMRRLNIFRQIKRFDEYITFERVYGRNILFVGCFAPKDVRVNYLVKKLKTSDRLSSDAQLQSQALDIIATDEDESDHDYGQQVVEVYPKADFILDCTNRKTLEESCKRLFRIYFGHPFISPTKDEYASYLANAAAYRSLDLSRQVGAAIIGKQGDIVSMGCNEVPHPGGGTYWCDETHDNRDYVKGYDSNQTVREDLARDGLAKLKKAGWLSTSKAQSSVNDLVQELFAKKGSNGASADGPWRDSMISNIIEYGRMVHAEMNALTDAARFNRSTVEATLYCTTMPCHMCTKLIIAAGISRVVYVQPYVKSLTSELYEDEVVFEGRPEDRRVNFESLKGVTPAGFKRAFAKSQKRKKDDGKAKRWNKISAQPTFLTTIPYYMELELELVSEIESLPSGVLDLNLPPPSPPDNA